MPQEPPNPQPIPSVNSRDPSEESRAWLAAIVESSADAIFSKNLDDVITSWNSSAERIFGYTPAEVMGLPVTLLVPPDRMNEEPEVLARIRRGESVEHYESVRRRKDGTLIDVSLTVSPILDVRGCVTGASMIVRDITGRKRTTRALRESEERLRLATEATEVGVWEWNLATDEVIWDAQMFRIYGLDPSPHGIIRYAEWIETVAEEDRPVQNAVLRQTIHRSGRSRREFRIRRGNDGECRHIQAVEAVRTDSAGRVEFVVGTNLDVTERRQREAALHASETRFRSAVGIVSSLIWTNDADGMMEGEQPGWGSFTGQTEADYRGYGWTKAVHPDDAQPTIRAWEQALAEKSLYEFEHRVRRHDGEWRLCSVRALPVLDDNGSIREWVGVHTDITERKRMELNVAFLATVSQDLLHLSDIGCLMQTLGTKLGAHLGLSRCNFAEVNEASGEIEVIHDWQRDQAQSLRGLYRIDDYVTPEFRKTARTGEPLVIHDTTTDPRTDAENHAALQIRSMICMPLVRDENWRFLLGIFHSEPHHWREDEVDLIREVTSRLWARVERSRAEDALATAMAESEQQRRLYNTVLSTTPDLIYIFDLEHRFIYANEALLELWQKRLEEAMGRNCLELGYEPWHAEMHDREIDQVIATKKPIRGEVPFTSASGRRHYDYIFAPVLNAQGEVEAVAGTTRDVTQRKQVEAAEAGDRKVFERVATGAPLPEILETLLREIESQSEDGMRCSILLLDRSGRHLLHGAAPNLPEAYSQALHGLPIGPQVGSCGTAAFTGEDVFVTDIAHDPRWVDYQSLASAHGLAACCSTPIISLEGSVLGTAAMYYDQPHLPGWHDLQLIRRATKLAAIIIERKNVEVALTEQTAALVRADRSKDEFLAMLAHELRNPLEPMRVAAEILEIEGAAEKDRKTAQRIIARQIENMRRMIDDLLDVSRITEGKIELRLQRVDLRTILAAVVESARSHAAANAQELLISLPENPVFLSADTTRLEQVFGNLLGNACKYSGSGTRISVTAELLDADQVEVRIADNGIGIDPELLPSIFDLFVQSSRTLDRSHGGLGIGLTIVHRLVVLHGGSIEAHSDGLGHGADFIIRLPLVQGVADDPLPIALPAAGERPLRMLIVDDNVDAAESMAILQQLRGHDTRTAHAGPDAVTVATHFVPEVVLLDIGLPELDGFEVARRIRAMPSMKSSLLIALTGYGTDADRGKSRDAGFDEHLSKPADLNLLRHWLSTRFPKS